MKECESGENKATRQCWECLKRRLVCDHTLPHCKKCRKAGRECSGYDGAKPLQWIETGVVTSKRRKKGDLPKVYIAQPSQKEKQQHVVELVPSLSPPLCDEDYICEPVEYEGALAAWTWEKGVSDNDHAMEFHMMVFKLEACAKEFDRLMGHGGRSKIEEVVSKGLHEEAARMLRSKRDPLKRLERLIGFLHTNDLPTYDYVQDQTSAVVQAVQYYNTRMLQEHKASGELVTNPALIFFHLQSLHLLSPAIHSTLVCYSLTHFALSLPAGTDRAITVANRSKMYQHRGDAIRQLSHYIDQDKTRCSDLTITSILMFMCFELQNPAIADWRSHVDGMKKLIDLRGGPKQLLKEAPHLIHSMIVYLLIIIMGNTCSPSWDQIEISDMTNHTITDVHGLYSLIFPYTLCPSALFLAVLRTNELRLRASGTMVLSDGALDLILEVQDLLARIEAFSPEDWAQPGPSYLEWLLIGTIYQSCISIYATISLQLPNTADTTTHGDRLLTNLRAALQSTRIAKFMVWPLVIAGVEAIYRSEATRYWIEMSLQDMSRLLGTSGPLKACQVLRAYWARGVRGWDECFQSACVFVV